MHIQFNSDNQVDGDTAMAARVEEEIRSKLARFGDRLTRIEIHVGDTNAEKRGSSDKRCAIEARPRNMQPVAATGEGATVKQAVTGAVAKLIAALDTTFGKQDARR